MKKVLISVIIMIILVFIGFEILTESNSILNSVSFSFKIWENNIFPSLFPFFILSELLVNYGFVEFLSELFKPIMNHFFKINSNAAFVFVMSMISGFPSNAKYTRKLYEQGLLNENEASKVLTFTHFSNPLFILGTVVVFLNNKEVGLLVLIVHYFTNLIIGFIFRNYYQSKKERSKISLKKAILNMHQKRISNNMSFGKIITTAINNSINTLLLILGTVTIFLIITTIIDNSLNINSYYQSIINGFIEMTQGLKYVSLLEIPLKLKTIIITMILSFGGLSVHMQVISILSDTKIKYLPFLTARLLHSAIAGIIIFFTFEYWINII